MTTRRGAFKRWRSERPFWGALLIALGGIEEFFSGQLDIGKIHIQLGLEGLQALVIPAVLVLLAILIALMPVHRIFYGIIALVLAIYSLIGVNLGGFVIGMVLAAVGGILVVAWMPRPAVAEAAKAPPEASVAPESSMTNDAQDVDELLGGLDDESETDASPARASSSKGRKGGSGKPRRRWLRGGAAAAVAGAVLTIAAVAPQPAHAATVSSSDGAVQSSCVLLIICSPSSPSPSPTPTSSSAPSSTPSPSSGGSTSSPTSPTSPTIGSPGSPLQSSSSGTQVAVPGQSGSSAPAKGQKATTSADLPAGDTTDTPLVALGDDNSHGIFTTPSANIDGDSLQIVAPSQVGVVSVPLANGSRATAIRIECQQLTIGSFHLDTTNRAEKVNLDTGTGGMTLKGNVVVWIDRVGTEYGASESLSQSLAANPLTLGPLMTLLGQGHLVLGLIGAQANTMTLSQFNLQPLNS